MSWLGTGINIVIIMLNSYENVREYRRGNENGQSRETGNMGYTRRRQTRQNINAIGVGHQYTQTNTNNVNKT